MYYTGFPGQGSVATHWLGSFWRETLIDSPD